MAVIRRLSSVMPKGFVHDSVKNRKREEVNNLVRQAGREPQPIQDGDVLNQESIDALNAEIKAMREADEMGLFLRRSDDDWGDEYVEPFEENYDVARATYEKAAASDALKFQESWQDKMAGLKILQNAIEKETGSSNDKKFSIVRFISIFYLQRCILYYISPSEHNRTCEKISFLKNPAAAG